MNNEQQKNESEVAQKEIGEETQENVGDGEFKVVVRKLEMPVKPRGVLADG